MPRNPRRQRRPGDASAYAAPLLLQPHLVWNNPTENNPAIEADSQLAKIVQELYNTTEALGPERSEEALEIHRQLIAQHKDARELAVRETVACAYFDLGLRLFGLGRSDEAIEVYEELHLHFLMAPRAELREGAASGLINKGRIFLKSNRPASAASAFRQALLIDPVHELRREVEDDYKYCLDRLRIGGSEKSRN